MSFEFWLPLFFILLGFLGVAMHLRLTKDSGSGFSDPGVGEGIHKNALWSSPEPEKDSTDTDTWQKSK